MSDEWSDWLLHRRHADDGAYAQVVRASVAGIANRLLDAAALAPGMTLADIGAGEGLIAFRAIERIGPSLRVLLTDISATMLEHVERLARERGVSNQCRFIEAPADVLAGIDDASVDVVATRAVLAYVADKGAALREFHRILKPGGRLSVAEPVLQDEAFYVRALKARLDAPTPGVDDRFLRLMHRWKSAQFPDTAEACAKSPIVNYSERDLLNFTRGAGFSEIHLQLHLDVTPSLVTTWEVFLGTSPHPWAASLGTIMAEQFTPDDRLFFERMVRPTVESGKNTVVDRVVYMNAVKPPV